MQRFYQRTAAYFLFIRYCGVVFFIIFIVFFCIFLYIFLFNTTSNDRRNAKKRNHRWKMLTSKQVPWLLFKLFAVSSARAGNISANDRKRNGVLWKLPNKKDLHSSKPNWKFGMDFPNQQHSKHNEQHLESRRGTRKR